MVKEGEALFMYGDFNFRLDLQSVVKVSPFTISVDICISVIVVFVFVIVYLFSAILFIFMYPIVVNHGLNGMGVCSVCFDHGLL